MGKWKIVDVKVTGTLANQVPEAYIKGQIQEFKSNGTYTISNKSGSGRYSYSGNSIMLDGEGYRLERLSPDRIRITYTETYYIGNKRQNLKSVLTLERITPGASKQQPKKATQPAPKPTPKPAPATATKKKKRTYRHVSGYY